jgi:hypothetical protein
VIIMIGQDGVFARDKAHDDQRKLFVFRARPVSDYWNLAIRKLRRITCLKGVSIVTAKCRPKTRTADPLFPAGRGFLNAHQLSFVRIERRRGARSSSNMR